jgi:hypothetical protein
MLVYVLSNVNQTLGVFSSLIEAQKYYSTLYNGLIPAFNLKLEEFRLNESNGKDMSLFLDKKPFEENISIKPKLNYYRGKYKADLDIFEPRRFLDSIDECDNCGGEDCVRNGECCNDNYDY